MTRATAKDGRLIVGGEARIELLPPEVSARAKARSTRRALVGVVVIAALAVGSGYGVATVAARDSAARLEAEQSRTTELLAQQREFVGVRQVEDQLKAVTAAKAVATSTEIEWQQYLDEVEGSLPTGVALTGFTMESATPLQAFPAPAAPLQGERIASLVLGATSPSISEIDAWLKALDGLTGFSDASPGSISREDETGAYTVTVTMHINQGAYSNTPASAEAVAAEQDSE